MNKRLVLATLCFLVFCVAHSQEKAKLPLSLPVTTDSSKPKKSNSGITDKVKSSKKVEGLFTLYQDTVNGSVQLYVKKDQLGKDFIYQSFSLNGPTALYLNQSMHRSNFIFKLQKAFDKIEFSRINTSFYYDPNNAISKTRDIDKPEAIVVVEKISAEDTGGYLINADALFLSERLDPVKPVTPPSFFSFPTFNLGGLSPSKSKYFAVKSFPSNTDIVVDLAYDNPGAFVSGGPDITDPRYVRVRMQHSFIEVPKNDFKPRRDDPRVGYYTEYITDQTSMSATPYKDVINRWHLVKKDPSAALSEPVEPIVYWVENTTPVEYRQTIIEAGLKWNKAFEKAGFKNAIQLKMMPDDADWDPSDLRYNVIRWVSSANPPYGAIGPNFTNPVTGQILGADITIEWNFASGAPIFDELFNGKKAIETSSDKHDYNTCSLGADMVGQFITGSTALDATGAPPGELKEMHKQFLTWAIMHEMGHTLGLNHNMRSSQMLSPQEINNEELTQKIGMIGSVMDYTAVNISLDRNKQGDYYTSVAGPYDLWVIEYGYTPLNNSEEEAGLNKILSRSTDPKLAFGNDGDDMRSPGKGMDPRVNVWDLTNDAIGYAEDRFKLVNGLMDKLIQKYSKPGQSYAELRARYNALQAQRFNMISAVSRYVGGVYVDRSFPDQKSESKPFTPVSIYTQKRAIDLLAKYVLAPNAYDADAVVFAYLQPQRRGFNQASGGDDYKITNNILGTQIAGALAHIMHPNTLQRITNSRLYGNQYSVAGMFSDLSNAIFAADLKTNVNVYRQYLQTAFAKNLLAIVDPKSPFYDDVAKAAALSALKKVKSQMLAATATNEETKAHRENLVFLINSGLSPK